MDDGGQISATSVISSLQLYLRYLEGKMTATADLQLIPNRNLPSRIQGTEHAAGRALACQDDGAVRA